MSESGDDERMEAGSVAPSGAASTRASTKKKGGLDKDEKIVLSRSEKEDFIAFLATRFDADAGMRVSWLAAKGFPRCRTVAARAAKDGFSKHSKCLEHRPTFLHVFSSAFAKMLDQAAAKLLAAHVVRLTNGEKGSKKLVVRREKAGKNSGRSIFRSKQKKHQCRHGN
ncbi:hypothetical protein M885DRAFT_510024 [Pelagophyceae sp. CCMP2097]|nr:hypothetical protein M885DRAFT_510024 [Pelagophyceae sp. CCMP2097]|mmetsp:Transcript_32771/g.110413  ORF Transcript_32771/g.110413 Transcript_32771/m.110413 type:complete len:168 (-) Transcript_32771:26-529(-)